MVTRREFLAGLTTGAAGAAAAAAAVAMGQPLIAAAQAATRSPSRPPNVVFILIDDLGWRDVGFMGSKFYETPRIDKFAAQSMVFPSAYTCGPNCAPTRACLLSGQYTPRHGVYTVGQSARGGAKPKLALPQNQTTLDASFITFAEALAPARYVKASIGKWHLGNDPELGPRAQGFDVNFGGSIAGNPVTYFSPYKMRVLPDGPPGEYLTDRLTDEALQFITANKDRPFFLYLPQYAVHTPLQAKTDMIAKYAKKPPDNGQSNATYAAMIESTDDGVGRILDKLDELGLADNTIVFFTSDNGGLLKVTSNQPLRGGKGMLYEGGIRVPLAVRWPGHIKPGSKCDTPVTSVDFYPTFLDLAGAPAPAGHTLDGESLVPLLTGAGTLKRESIYWHFPCYLDVRTTPVGAIRRGDWKLMEFFEDGSLELYNTRDDLSETKNLAAALPDKTKELHTLLVAWQHAVNAPIPKPL